MVRLVEEFLDRYFEELDKNGLFSQSDSSVPDAVVLSNSVIVTPDNPAAEPRVYSYGPNKAGSSINMTPAQMKVAVNNAMKKPNIPKVEIKGENADIADIYNPTEGRYVSETDTNWDNWQDEYRAKVACEAAKGAVEDYLIGRKSGIPSPHADQNVAKVQKAYSKERANQIAMSKADAEKLGLAWNY